jgi:transcriptional regulator with XRE-family HTH domain
LLREARKTAGLTQREVARRSGVSQPHISAYENGRRQPTVPTMARLIEATGNRLLLGLAPPAYRPVALAEIAPEIAVDQPGSRGGRWFWIREFLRGFHDDAESDAARAALIADEPPGTGLREWDAVLAAVAEHLSFHHGLPCPEWVHDGARFAERAWFLSDLPSQRAWAVETSPASFRRRNLFVLPVDLHVA